MARLIEIDECGQTADGLWRLVPKEPTDEMLDEGYAWAEGETIIDASRNARKIWAAMLDASPSPSDEQEHKRGETKKAERFGSAK